MTTEQGARRAGSSDREDVFSPLLQRIAAASGILFVALVILSIILSPEETPDWAAPAAEFSKFNADNDDSARLGGLLLLLSSLELLWFAGYLRGEHGRFEGEARGFTRLSHVVLAGGVVAAAGLALTAITGVVAASQMPDTPPEVVRSMHQLSYAMFALASVGLVVLTTASGLLILRTRVLPNWLGWVALVTALFQFLTLFIVLSPDDEDFIFGFAWFPGFIGLLIWALGASILFVRGVGRPAEHA